jgi:glycosyltransferase involved in cell wall biosynthesis
LKLLLTATAYPPSIGGAQLYLHQLARALTGRHDVQVVSQWDAHRTDWLLGTTLRGPAEPVSYEQDGVPVRRIALPRAARRRLAPWVAAYYALQGPALRRIAGALAEEMLPYAAGAEVVHNCRIGREGLTAASLAVARRRGVPFVLTPVHHPRWGGFLHRHYTRMYREADAVIALTAAERDTLAALGVDRRKIFVTGMGPILSPQHDARAFRERHQLGSHMVVLFVGQKYAYKGVQDLLAAAPTVWTRAPETRFVFVGPRTPHSRRLFARVRDPRIVETDTVSLQEKTDAIAACDVLCLPSTQESFGAVFTEAWSLGKPVVGYDIPAVRSVIDDGRDGLLSTPGAEALAACLLRLAGDDDLRGAMGERGREKVAREFTWPVLAAKTEEVYRKLLAPG